MRISSSLLLILAAITMANAVTPDSVAHPNHKLVRVKNGAAHINALNTAKTNLNTDKLDLHHLVSIAARGVDVSALGAAHAAAKTVDLKHVAGIVHTLSASLEGHTTEADRILKLKDHKVAVGRTKRLLRGVEVDLAHAYVDIDGLGKDGGEVAKVGVKGRSVEELKAVVDAVGAEVGGGGGLVSLLEGVKVDAVLESDVVSVLADVEVLKVLHDVVGVDTVLSAVLAVPDSVTLLENIKQLDDPVRFVDALVDVHDLTALVAAVPAGVGEIVKVEGAAKLVDYVGKYGFNTVARIFETVGVESVLKAVVALPSSVKLLEAVKSVVDVSALVSGLHVLNAVAFVESIKAVDDVAVLTNVVLNVVGKALSKRAELLQSVDGTLSGVESAIDANQVLSLVKRAEPELLDNVSGTLSGLSSTLGLQKVLKLKRAIAHISALPDSDLVTIDEAVKRSLIDNVDVSSLLNNVDIAKIGLLKRSILDLSSVINAKEVDEIVDDVVKRGLIDKVDVSSLLNDVDIAKIGLLKRGMIDSVEVSSLLNDVDIAKVGLLKRSVVDVSSVVDAKEVDQLVGDLVKRDVHTLDTAAGIAGGALSSTGGATGFATASTLNTVETAKRDAVENKKNSLIKLDSVLSLLKRQVVSNSNELIDLPLLLSVLKRSPPLPHLSTLDDVTPLDLVHILPPLRRALTAAAHHPPHTVDYTTTLHTRHSAGALLTEAVQTLLPTVSTLLTRVVRVTDVIDVDAVRVDVREKVVPLVAAVGRVLDGVVRVQAPGLEKEVERIGKLAEKTVKALP